MSELLLFFPILILSGILLSALHFDDLDDILSYALENIIQLLIGALVVCLIVYMVTPG